LASAAGTSGNAIERAIATLEASPRGRTAIERTGLSVRDFVLETVALAQAAEAESGKAPGGANVPPENVQFVQRYQSRIMQARAETRARRARVETYDESDTTSVGVQPRTDTAPAVERGDDSARSNGQPQELPKPPVDTLPLRYFQLKLK